MCDIRNSAASVPDAEDWVAMLITELGATNTHIINKVSGSGASLKNFLGSWGFFARTGFLAENVHFCRHCNGMQGKGVLFRHLNLTHFVGDRVEWLTDIANQTQRLATLFLIPTMYASGRVDDSNLAYAGNTLATHGIETILDLGEVGCHCLI